MHYFSAIIVIIIINEKMPAFCKIIQSMITHGDFKLVVLIQGIA